MLVVFGLGNPGGQYERTRHNVGFDVLDVFCQREHLSMTKLDHHGLISESGFGSGKLILVKPQTFMNLSGNCVSEVISWYKPKPEEILIVGDSLTSDIRGGINAGIRTCWYNPKKLLVPEGYRIDHEISDLNEVFGIL